VRQLRQLLIAFQRAALISTGISDGRKTLVGEYGVAAMTELRGSIDPKRYYSRHCLTASCGCLGRGKSRSQNELKNTQDQDEVRSNCVLDCGSLRISFPSAAVFSR